MRFTWDPAKDAPMSAGMGSHFGTQRAFLTDRRSLRLWRSAIYAIGLVNGIEVTVIYTDRDRDERHIMSTWRSEPHERRYFWNHLED